LVIYIVRSCKLKISLDNAKRSFHRSVNAIFGKVGRIASEEVVLHLDHIKCLPILLYGLEVKINNKKAQLTLTNPRDTKACRKLLQFDV